MIISPRIKGFICTTAHPAGCMARVRADAEAAARTGGAAGPKRILVVGASGGYGLACRIAAAFGWGADTVGVSFERGATEAKTGTAGHYNNAAFDALAHQRGLTAVSINGDAFSSEVKAVTANTLRNAFQGKPADLVVYSLAAPRRTDPVTGEVYASVIKPAGETFTGKSIDTNSGIVSKVSISPASGEEIRQTVKVMGGEDWLLWMQMLLNEGLLAQNCLTLAFSYIGPAMTHAIYKDGSIGRAKLDLEQKQRDIDALLAPLGGKAFISVNKALVTQASSAIPVVPLYISLLYRVMKENGTHEDSQAQMGRLLHRLYPAASSGAWDRIPTDGEGRIRMDDWEMNPSVQSEISRRWEAVTSENAAELADLEGYRSDFLRIFGFGLPGLDYSRSISPVF